MLHSDVCLTASLGCAAESSQGAALQVPPEGTLSENHHAPRRTTSYYQYPATPNISTTQSAHRGAAAEPPNQNKTSTRKTKAVFSHQGLASRGGCVPCAWDHTGGPACMPPNPTQSCTPRGEATELSPNPTTPPTTETGCMGMCCMGLCCSDIKEAAMSLLPTLCCAWYVHESCQPWA